MTARIVVEFEFEAPDADGVGEAQREALQFLVEHAQDDEDQNPIRFEIFEIT